MKKLLTWILGDNPIKRGRSKRVFKRNGIFMKSQLVRMGNLNQGFVSMSAQKG